MDNNRISPFQTLDFAGRLQDIMRQRGVNQSQLATALGISRSTITGWLRYGKLPDAAMLAWLCGELNCSADWLLGLESQTEKSAFGVRWFEQIPPSIQGAQREQIEQGIQRFHRTLSGDLKRGGPSNGFNWESDRFALQAALRSGSIRLTHVERSTEFENELRRLYPFLKDVIVATEIPGCRDTIVRTELVAFLAATEVLAGVVREGAVGLSSGYTVLRMGELSIPSIDQFSGTRWVPLIAFANQEAGTVYTANYNARMMSVRHPGSQALYLPHENECASDRMRAQRDETLRVMRNVRTIFFSVSGVDRREHADSPHLLAQFRSADYTLEAPDLRQAYDAMDDKSRFGGEVLRCLIDRDGQLIAQDAMASPPVNLDLLRYNSDQIGKVCIVAARRYKALAVHTCLRNRLANALVIDSAIARYVIEQTEKI